MLLTTYPTSWSFHINQELAKPLVVLCGRIYYFILYYGIFSTNNKALQSSYQRWVCEILIVRIQPTISTKWISYLVFITFHVNRRLEWHPYTWNKSNSFSIVGYVKRIKRRNVLSHGPFSKSNSLYIMVTMLWITTSTRLLS